MKRQIAISIPSLDEQEWLAIKEPLTTGWLTQGPKVAEFEKAFSQAYGLKHSVAVTSCTTALHLALAAFGIGPGDEVIVPSFSWVSTANAVEYCGATPVFVDVDPMTYNINPNDIASKLTAKTKAIVPVHLFGLCADMDAVKKDLPKSIFVLEDAACAAGAQYKGTYAGALGHAACFSFHPRKSLTTGEGGMVSTADVGLYDKMICLRNHGASPSEAMRKLGAKPYMFADFDVLGYNYRMTDIQAAMGIVQLNKLNGFIEERAKWAQWYANELADVAWLRCPQMDKNGRHAWQAYVTYVHPDKAPFPRDVIMEKLQEMGVSTRPGTQAIHMLGYYKNKYGLKDADLPGAQACYWNTMALPLHNKMTEEDYAYVVQCLRSL